MTDFLGYGLLRPFQWDGKSDFANAGGRRLIESTMGQVLGTRAAGGPIRGELPWRDTAGSLLYLLKHGNNTMMLRETARIYVQDAIRKWLPQVGIIDVEVISPENISEDNKVYIKVKWELINRNNTRNRVILGGGTSNFSIPV